MITMNDEEFSCHREEFDGICASCGEITFGGVEPDAQKYKCASCGKMNVLGMELALIAGLIEFEEECYE